MDKENRVESAPWCEGRTVSQQSDVESTSVRVERVGLCVFVQVKQT